MDMAISQARLVPLDDKAGPASAYSILIYGIGFQIALLIPSAIAMAIDERLVNEISIWTKPIKFQLSLSLHMLTMIWLLPLVTREWLHSRTLRWTAAAVACAALFETAYITLQSSRGRGSHYIKDTPIEGVMWGLMGVGAVILVLGSFVLGVAIWRSKSTVQSGYRYGAILGLTIGSILTLVTAGYMSSSLVVETGRWIGDIKTDAKGLPLVGWSRTGGDLRVSHFFATHMMQALPLLGLLADSTMPKVSRIVIVVATVLATGLVAYTFRQALQGQPFLVMT